MWCLSMVWRLRVCVCVWWLASVVYFVEEFLLCEDVGEEEVEEGEQLADVVLQRRP